MKDLVNKAVICWKFFKNVLYQDVNIFFSHLLIVSKIGNPLIKNNRPKSYLFFIFILSSFLQVNIFAQTVPATNSLQSISAGGFHTCGITNDTNKSLYCWGYNNDGQLGNNSTTRSLVPVQVLGGAQGGEYLTGVSQVSTKSHHTCAVTSAGALYCWGYNYDGQLGNNSTTRSLVPVRVLGGGSRRRIFGRCKSNSYC